MHIKCLIITVIIIHSYILCLATALLFPTTLCILDFNFPGIYTYMSPSHVETPWATVFLMGTCGIHNLLPYCKYIFPMGFCIISDYLNIYVQYNLLYFPYWMTNWVTMYCGLCMCYYITAITLYIKYYVCHLLMLSINVYIYYYVLYMYYIINICVHVVLTFIN